jgi:AraC-like DNA-binding protein
MDTTILHSHLIDINTAHAASFRFDYSSSTNHLMMCFRSPAIILTVNGMETAQPGDCIIHSLNFHLLHHSVPHVSEGFRNDWLYVQPETLAPLMNELQLPWNTLIRTGQPKILTPYIKRMMEELAMRDELSEQAIINQLNDMLLTIARCYRKLKMLNHELTSTERRYFPEFVAIRNRIREDCRQEFTLTALAAEVNLSKERFAVLYRQFFKETPYAELIEARLVMARRLLLNSDMEVKEISIVCGWDDIHYFSRLFKKKIGISPTQYRNQAIGR